MKPMQTAYDNVPRSVLLIRRKWLLDRLKVAVEEEFEEQAFYLRGELKELDAFLYSTNNICKISPMPQDTSLAKPSSS